MKIGLIILFFAVGVESWAQSPIFTTAKTKSVTVYSNAAELSQTANLNLPIGANEIVIKNVANYIDENTIQLAVPPHITILSTQFTKNYISEYEIDESNPAIKKVRDSINYVQKEINKIQIDKQSCIKTIELLDNNQKVTGDNGLDFAELVKVVDYYKTKRSELSNTIATLSEKELLLTKKLANLNSKLEVNTKNEEKTSNGKLILQVTSDKAGVVDLNLSYLTLGANWLPFYDLKADDITAPIDMIYKAQIVQNTGVDWKKVKLTLSSGTPNQNNYAPVLQTWFVDYYDKSDNMNAGYRNNATLDKMTSSYKEKKSIVQAEAVYEEADAELATLSDYTQINENQLNTSFDIDLLYDILSNGKVHSVSMKEMKLPARYQYYAVPRASNDVFLMAEISDYSSFNLLPGQANVIFNGSYVGKFYINPSQTKDSLSLSMGRDKKISILRDKVVDKSGTKLLSSYKEQTFTYDITVRNNKKENIELKLEDQYPVSTRNDITIELLENGNGKVNKETGIITWKLKLLENESKKIRISYKVKSPKDLILSNLY